ncbi:MAG: transcriptional regulator [Oceanospirillaceae bacterium]|uniref:hypothetical protein n=1 Tax=unclassified Thalassolituus TaxID=2624967 RepID=UPI000C36477A|nr:MULTISPECIES: hypothetical protein [unclassified Thalassolituus]MBS54988.1 transcriptional regulator [Oceanospirillaceae bacterium]
MYHYTMCGLENVYLKNGYEQKETPSGKVVSIHDLDGLHKAIGKGLATKDSELTAKEFKFLRGELDLSQRTLGMLMEKSDQIIAKYEKGEQAIPRLVDKSIRDLYMESIGEGPIANLLQKLAQLDRKNRELTLELEETESGWLFDHSVAC